MSLSRLSAKCQACPDVLTCDHKRMEAVAYFKEVASNAGIDAAQPTLIPHDYRNIKINNGMTMTIDVEELKRELERSIYKRTGLMYGA